MCWGGGGGGGNINLPPPPPLAPPPPPPAPPTAPLPEPTPVETDINPQIREDKKKKPRNEMTQGTQELRIPLADDANTGGAEGGVNA